MGDLTEQVLVIRILLQIASIEILFIIHSNYLLLWQEY